MEVTPFYKEASFYVMIVAIIGQFLAALKFNIEAEMFGTIAGTIIAWFVAHGYLRGQEIKAIAQLKYLELKAKLGV